MSLLVQLKTREKGSPFAWEKFPVAHITAEGCISVIAFNDGLRQLAAQTKMHTR